MASSPVRPFAVLAVAAVAAALALAAPAVAGPNAALVQHGLDAAKRGDFARSCSDFATVAARTKQFTVGIEPHAAAAGKTDPDAIMQQARKYASADPSEACAFAYLAAIVAVGKNDAASTRAYAGEAALYARRAGITPPASAPAAGARVVSANAGTPPVGQYGCATAPAVLAGSGAYGTMLHQLGQWQGDIWVLDGRRYAGPYHKNDVGTYRMQGEKLVALTGSYAPPRNDTEIVYAPAAGDHAAALHIAFLDHGKPLIGLWCVKK